MIFTDVAGGEAIFLDANTLVYHFAPILFLAVRAPPADPHPAP